MSQRPKRHHYVPEFHLAAFTEAGTPNGRLWVYDLARVRQWGPCRPREVAFQRDFNRVDELKDPDAYEKGFALVESTIAPAFRGVIFNESLPSWGQEFVDLLNLVALAMIRSPRTREMLEASQVALAYRTAEGMLETPEKWSEIRAKMEAAGEKPAEVSYEEMRAFALDRSRSYVEVGKGSLLNLSVELTDMILPELLARHWGIGIAPDDSPGFVCSDQPVSLEWMHRRSNGMIPGFRHAGTMAIFPLGRRIVLLGTRERIRKKVLLSHERVAWINTCTIEASQGQVFVGQQEFDWLDQEGAIRPAQALLAMQVIRATRPGKWEPPVDERGAIGAQLPYGVKAGWTVY